MSIGRQYFTICPDYLNESIYVIGGFNNEFGVLNSVEKFNLKARKWVHVENIN